MTYIIIMIEKCALGLYLVSIERAVIENDESNDAAGLSVVNFPTVGSVLTSKFVLTSHIVTQRLNELRAAGRYNGILLSGICRHVCIS